MLQFLRLRVPLFHSLLLGLCLLFAAHTNTYAQAFRLTPDTLRFTPMGGTTVNGSVRVYYNGDSTGPGDRVHAQITSGSSFFSVRPDTLVVTRSRSWYITYTVQSSAVSGVATFTDDTTTRTVILLGAANGDAPLRGMGPYFTGTVPEHGTLCANLTLINPGSDPDTVVSYSWSHDPAGLFTLDSSVQLPFVMPTNDTVRWNVCFHAPADTAYRIDTLTITYNDAQSAARTVRRIIACHASDTSLVQCYGIFAQSVPFTEVGDTSRFQIFISNRLGSSASLDSLHISGPSATSFRIDTVAMPHAVGSHQYDSLWARFIPRRSTNSNYSAAITAYFTTQDTTHCRTTLATLTGSAAITAMDTMAIALGDTSQVTVSFMTSDTGQAQQSHRFNLFNHVGVRIRIDTCYLTNTQHFYIAQQIRPRFPDTLLNGAHHSVILHFIGDSSKSIFHDTLVVTMENAIASFYVIISGYSKGAKVAGVPEARLLSSATDLRMWPNPTGSMASIQSVGLQSVTTEISDALGHVIARHDGADLWQWDTRGADGARMPAGTYFVRVEGITALGERVVLTRPLAVTQR